MAKQKENEEMRTFLRRYGLTQLDIAAAAGKKPSTVCKWLRSPLEESKRAEIYALAVKAYETRYGSKMKALTS